MRRRGQVRRGTRPGRAATRRGRASRATLVPQRGRSLVAKHQVSTLGTRVRFPPPAFVTPSDGAAMLSGMKTKERLRARELRNEGRSIKEIARLLRVSGS